MSLPQIAGHELQEIIGRGSCGSVYRAINAHSRTDCAVKVFSSMAINRKLLAIAMRGLQEMPDHPGLLKPLECDFDNSPYYVTMPLVGFKTEDGASLSRWETPTLESSCGHLPPDEAWRYIYEICDAMAWLHKHNLVHCNLKTRDILMQDDQSSVTKITDPVQGWVGGLYHFDATDHFMYMPPEQAEHPENLPMQGTGWDVYAFGVIAYRLLTGRFPRAHEVYDEQIKKLNIVRGGTPHSMDNTAILLSVKSQPEITWPNKPSSKWDGRRKAIIERCLELDARVRWPDLREVMRDFEKLEADFLLEDAKDKIEIEKRRQARKVASLRMAAIAGGVLFCAFALLSAYGIWRWRNSDNVVAENQRTYEKTLTEAELQRRHEIEAREGKISALAQQLSKAHENKRLADANLQVSQATVDQFLSQLLDMPTGIGLEAEISEKQLNDALAFCEKERERLQDNEDFLPERARNYFNTAQLMMRTRHRAEALDFFTKARETSEKLIAKEPDHSDTPRRQGLLGRTCRWLGMLKAEDGQRAEALELFQHAVKSLTPALAADVKNAATRIETASAWFELGRRLRRDQQAKQAAESLAQIPAVLDEKIIGEELTPQEQFIVAKSRIEQGLAERDLGKVDDAMKTIFEAMESLVKLVEKSAPHNQEQALALAESYVEFGEIVAGKLGSTDGKEAQSEAMTILVELVRQHPTWPDPRYVLARCYGDLAALERDLGQPTEANRRQTAAIETLKVVGKAEPDSRRYRMELARLKSQQAQLYCDLGRAKDGVALAKEASAILEDVINSDDAVMDKLERKSCGVLLAQLYGVLGYTSDIAKETKLAKTSFAQAAEQWQKLKDTFGSDDVIAQGISWSEDRLKKFK